MRRPKVLSIATSILLASSIIVPSSVFGATKSFNANPSVMDVGSKLRADTVAAAKAEHRVDFPLEGADAAGGTAAAQSVTPDDVGTKVVPWVVTDFMNSGYTLRNFTLRAIGTYGEVWVANNLNFPAGDPRNSMVTITDTQVNYLLNEFDTRMYEKEVEFFAPPAERKGEHGYLPEYFDDSGRVVILIDNIRDEGYSDSNYPSYVAGYFSPTVSDFTDRNVMTIDAFDWVNRTGPNAAKPYLYEGVFAHEFQHLLHSDTDGAEENFVNEGLSDFAQFLVGYGHSQGHVDFFMNNLRNSLTIWGDQTDLQILGDYGAAYLFQLYLYDQYGESFIQKEFHNQKLGIDGVNDTLAQVGAGKTFADTYADFMTAIMVDGKYKGDNAFNFNSIDLKPNVQGSQLGDNVAPAWGTDFKVITPDKKIENLYFKGIDFLRTNWTAAADADKGQVLWGNMGDLADNFLIKPLDLTNVTAPSITFDTKYDIEEQWDFGVVQVSTDNGQTWKSLANANTREDLVEDGHPKIRANLPGFTGTSDGWTTQTFDLSTYAGQKVLLGFRYITDWGANGSGWYLSDLRLNGVTIDPMTSTDGFMSLEKATGKYVDYQVSFIGYKKGEAKPKVLRFPNLLNMSEQDRIDLRDMVHSSEYSKIVMMTTFAAPAGTNGSVNYEYDVVMKDSTKKTKTK
ncbi:choice-of-anchor J domain-containing protein [Cohnella kolymensis]|uniref:choice-of-anchor J domain-containing protein n=1 Tax=Cohnella kolymensis TaxID=1590652 RepID=UPI00069871B2|nr:choice-of-anchor J domain-containing protein [Cohnella kolymensis]